MPTISVHHAKDGSITYRVRIRMKGKPLQSASFPTRQDAQRWAKLRAAEMLTQRHFPERRVEHTFADLLERYEQDVLPRKVYETQRRESYLLAFWKKRFGFKLLTDLTKADIVKVRDEFLAQKAKATTIHRYLNILSHVLNTAIRDYDWIDRNVVSLMSRPALPP